MNILQLFEEEGRKSEIPSFQAGDSVRVHVRVIEGEKERIQMFEGVVIARKGGSNRLWHGCRTHFSTPLSHDREDRRGATRACTTGETLLFAQQEG
jgi:ribosomal L19-like protein